MQGTVLTICSVLYSSSLALFFTLYNWNFIPIEQQVPVSPFLQSLTTIDLLSVSVSLTTTVTSHTWTHSICPLVTSLFHLTTSLRFISVVVMIGLPSFLKAE